MSVTEFTNFSLDSAQIRTLMNQAQGLQRLLCRYASYGPAAIEGSDDAMLKAAQLMDQFMAVTAAYSLLGPAAPQAWEARDRPQSSDSSPTDLESGWRRLQDSEVAVYLRRQAEEPHRVEMRPVPAPKDEWRPEELPLDELATNLMGIACRRVLANDENTSIQGILVEEVYGALDDRLSSEQEQRVRNDLALLGYTL